MGEGDYMPTGGHRRKADPKHARKIKEGGRKAQKIAKETTSKHLQEEVPLAEEELLKALEEVKNSNIKSAKK
ncbi:MAG: hypothetical protein V1880_00705 [Patescibacteria group bacterium]